MSQKYHPRRLLSYVVASDKGLAPNVAGGLCTLAVCKPVVRQVSKVGHDWIIGVSIAAHGPDRVIYAMQVDEKVSYDDFFRDPRFAVKKPDAGPMGDNFFRHENGRYRIAFNTAAHFGKAEKIVRDLRTPLAVIGERFWYFGDNAPSLPRDLSKTSLAVPGHGGRRGHRVNEDTAVIGEFVSWIGQFSPGVHGRPRDLP